MKPARVVSTVQNSLINLKIDIIIEGKLA